MKKKLIILLTSLLCLGFGTNLSLAQETEMAQNSDEAMEAYSDYTELEKAQGAVEFLNTRVYRMMRKYPQIDYTYSYDDKGRVRGVTISGVNNDGDIEKIEGYLIDLESNRQNIQNLVTRGGYYYKTETPAKPKIGYKDFYNKLYQNIGYPENAKDAGIEGNIFVHFLVDAEGEVTVTKTIANIEGEVYDRHQDEVNKLKMEAANAIKETSGMWEPAKIGENPVAEYKVLPVEFDLKSYPSFYTSFF